MRSRRAVIQLGQELQHCPSHFLRQVGSLRLSLSTRSYEATVQSSIWIAEESLPFMVCSSVPTLWPATGFLHNLTSRFLPGEHICFPNVLLTDTRPPTELHNPRSAHIHSQFQGKNKLEMNLTLKPVMASGVSRVKQEEERGNPG